MVRSQSVLDRRHRARQPSDSGPVATFRAADIFPAVKWVIGIAALSFGLLAAGAAFAQVPPGYEIVVGSPDVSLNPAHQGSVGSEYDQDCEGLPRPPLPGEVAWHFILPQSVSEEGPAGPERIFEVLRVTFATAGEVILTDFGPPTAAHA
jgi:hypothetical protein